MLLAAGAFGTAALVVAVGIVRPPARVRAFAARARDRLDRPVTIVLFVFALVSLVRALASGAWVVAAIFVALAALLGRDVLGYLRERA